MNKVEQAQANVSAAQQAYKQTQLELVEANAALRTAERAWRTTKNDCNDAINKLQLATAVLDAVK
jgi:multidrug resistance efflux pump